MGVWTWTIIHSLGITRSGHSFFWENWRFELKKKGTERDGKEEAKKSNEFRRVVVVGEMRNVFFFLSVM